MKWLIKVIDYIERETWWRKYYRRVTVVDDGYKCMTCECADHFPTCNLIEGRDCPCKENQRLIVKRHKYENRKMWHDGGEKPQTGRIMFESTDGGLRFADYDLERDRFDCDDECYYSGMWEHCHIKRWIYEKELLDL